MMMIAHPRFIMLFVLSVGVVSSLFPVLVLRSSVVVDEDLVFLLLDVLVVLIVLVILLVLVAFVFLVV